MKTQGLTNFRKSNNECPPIFAGICPMGVGGSEGDSEP